MSPFWHWLVVIITVASMAGCLWLLFANARRKLGEGEGEGDDTGHIWDEDLREYNNPLPRWWLNWFVITIVFGAGYLLLYPGLGNLPGRLGWTQSGQLAENLGTIQNKRNALYAAFKDKDIATLSLDPSANNLGRAIFLNNCAGCHGADARGARGFPNLTDRDWLYGDKPEDIVTSITMGRNGQMPFFNGAIPADTLDDLIKTVALWSDPALNSGVRDRGMKQFAITCAACHGPDGTGNPMIGAPNLTDDIWLHGSSRKAIRETVLFGRKSAMPAHENILAPDDIRLVSAYVYGLSKAP